MPIDVADVTSALQQLEERLEDGTQPLAAFDIEVKGEIGLEWGLNARAEGGYVRGQWWEGFADQYTRKTDGVTVPAWGGVPKVKLGYRVIGRRLSLGTMSDRGRGRATYRGLRQTTPVLEVELKGYRRGTVQGRLRPSGGRVTPQSILMVDRGRLRNAVLTRQPWIRHLFGSTILRIGNELPSYATAQFIDNDRNPLRWVPDDEAKLRRHVDQFHERLTVEFNSRPGGV